MKSVICSGSRRSSSGWRRFPDSSWPAAASVRSASRIALLTGARRPDARLSSLRQRRIDRDVESEHMRVLTTTAMCLFLLAAPSAQTRSPAGAVTPQIDSVLKAIKAADKGLLAVSEEDGRFLRVLVATRAAKSILEIGAASGYSGIWLGLGARETGGRVVAIEYDPQRAREAADNVRRAGVTDVVRVIHGDAFAEIPKLPGTFDLVFLDAWKPDYKKFFDMVYPRLNAG